MSLSNSYVIRSTFAFLAVGLLVLLGIVGMTLWLNERAQVYFGQVIESRDTRAAAVELRNAVQTAESSQRGFMVLGNEIYLAPYDTAKVKAQRQLETLKDLLTGYPETQTATDRLTAILAEKFDEMDHTITLKRAQQDAEALEILRTNKGKALTDEANLFLSGIIRQADDRLVAGVDEQRNNASLLRAVSAFGALAIIAVVGGAAYVLLTYTRELRRSRMEVEVLNSSLERRVSERTHDLEEARDRAQLLLSEVNHRVANSLAMVSSLVSLQSKSLKDDAARAALKETQDRILAIALVHRRLYGSGDVGVVKLDEYLAGLLDHLKTSLSDAGQGARVIYELDPVPLSTDASISLGVVVAEWVTNAAKYAYPDGQGEIRVKLRQMDGGMAQLAVEDDGVGKVDNAPAKGTGVGTRIVTAMAAGMRASIDYARRERGTAALLTFPAAQPQ
jgi:two-component sensor histidine kinase